MKIHTLIYIIFCLGLIFSSTTDAIILQPKKSIILEPTDNQIYFFFNTESYDVREGDKDILFQIKSIKGSLESNTGGSLPISYKFIASQDAVDLESNPIPNEDHFINFETSKKEMKNTNGTEYEIKFFKIVKQSSTTENWLYVKITTIPVGTQKIYVEISNIEKIPSSINVPSGSSSNLLKKYGSITVDASDYYVFFDCSDFDDGEDMYFKIQAYEDAYYEYDLSNGIYYDYINNDPNQDFNNIYNYVEYGIKTDIDRDSLGYSLKTKYFTIKKNKNLFRGGDGNLMYISFYFYYGKVTITNTEEDEGKLKTWEIVLIVIACVIVVGLAIFCICWRRRKALQARAAMNTPYAANGYPPNAMAPPQPYY